MHDLDAVGLKGFQEPNNLDIHDCYFFEIQDKIRSVLPDLALQYLNVLRLKVTNQSDCCDSIVGILFDLQCPPV